MTRADKNNYMKLYMRELSKKKWKNDEIKIGISSEDKLKLKARAREYGLSLSSYCLLVLLTIKLKPPIELDEE